MTIALPRKQDKKQMEPTTNGGAPLSVVKMPKKQRPPDPNYLAHDARNWLTVLQVYCDLLRTSGAVNSGYEPWIEELSSAVERGHTLVASLLDSVERAEDKRDDQGDSNGGEKPKPRVAPQHPVAPQHSLSPANGAAPPSNLSLSPCLGNNRTASAAVCEFPSGESLSGKVPPLDIADAIARRQPMFEHLAGSRIHVEIDAPADAGNIAMPESEFERILQNLVSNAIEAMPNGGRLRLAVLGNSRSPAGTAKQPAPNTLLLQVSDTGGGISPERLPAIFEPGVSSKGVSSKEISGKKERAGDWRHHGFGLAIVQDLTERAGGWVRVQSQPGRGSCFELEFPRI